MGLEDAAGRSPFSDGPFSDKAAGAARAWSCLPTQTAVLLFELKPGALLFCSGLCVTEVMS